MDFCCLEEQKVHTAVTTARECSVINLIYSPKRGHFGTMVIVLSSEAVLSQPNLIIIYYAKMLVCVTLCCRVIEMHEIVINLFEEFLS